jgi:glycosyltransferase involved in cell wall biosynthesis
MNSSINVFVPVYNEIDSIGKIEENIRRAVKVFSDVCFYYFDNASDDGTFEVLLQLQQKYQAHVRVNRNPENIGFQKNLSNIAKLPKDRMILILGANDKLYTRGLRKLHSILCQDDFDLIVCNCGYVSGGNKLKLLPTDAEDFIPPFAAYSLDEYFKKRGTIPNGIMQFVLHPRHSHLFGNYDTLMSPQVGVFFHFFPGKVYYFSDPPIVLVNKIEQTGWRSTAEGILETHLVLAKDVIELAWKVCKRRQMTMRTFLYIRFCYTHAVFFLIYKAILVKDFWGSWQLTGEKKIAFVFNYCKRIFSMDPYKWMNLFFVIVVGIHYLIHKAKKIKQWLLRVFL